MDVKISAVPMDRIKTDPEIQMRTKDSQETLDEYERLYRANVVLPPPVVFIDSIGECWLADGNYRLRARRLVGDEHEEYPNIVCVVHKGTRQDAIWYAVAANQKHGLQRTRADTRRAVEMALKHPTGAKLSDNAIAGHCGVDHKTVASVRAEMIDSGEVGNFPTRTGKDGVEQPAHKPRRPPEWTCRNCGKRLPDKPEKECPICRWPPDKEFPDVHLGVIDENPLLAEGPEGDAARAAYNADPWDPQSEIRDVCFDCEKRGMQPREIGDLLELEADFWHKRQEK